MPETYQIPAIALIAALMLAFGYLHLRFRTVRTRLWLLAMACVEAQALLLWMAADTAHRAQIGIGNAGLPMSSVWLNAAGAAALMMSSGLLMASLSPLTFRVGRLRVLYVVPYIVPMILYAVLYYGVDQHPTGTLLYVFCGLAIWATAAGLAWCLHPGGAVPVWIAGLILGFAVSVAAPSFFSGDVYWPLLVAETGNMLMTVLLVIFTVRRLTPGVFLVTVGFLAWGVPPLLQIEVPNSASRLVIYLARAFILGKVAVAMGFVLLALEDQVKKNQTAQDRERRVRVELEAYSRQSLTARSLEEFDRECGLLCTMIVQHSRFSKAAMVVRAPGGSFTLVGYAGMDGATAGALDALAQRLPENCLSDDQPMLAPGSTSVDLDVSPWLTPGDDLERVRLTRLGAVPMFGPDKTLEGLLLLAGLRAPEETLRADDLLPLEILAGRLQAARSQAMMLGKLIESERYAGVGQLATNVAQQLNNPLTVILGYAALLEESLPVGGADRRGSEAIVIEARRMKAILERLSRFSRLGTERFSSFSVSDLVNDIEQLHRIDFLRSSIEFRYALAPDLPAVFGNLHQIRQALMHAMQFAMEQVLPLDPYAERAIRIDATADHGRVQIMLGHSGAHFLHPERAFDALTSGFSGAEPTGVGLSLCAAIVREHRGNITAVNLEPHGAAVVIDLPIS